MDTISPPVTPPANFLLTADDCRAVVDALRTGLPAPVPNTPEQRELRDQAAIATVASMHPVNLAEAMMAANFVVMHETAMDCLRLSNVGDERYQMQFRHQAVQFMNRSQSMSRLLLQMQADRQKREQGSVAAPAKRVARPKRQPAPPPPVMEEEEPLPSNVVRLFPRKR